MFQIKFFYHTEIQSYAYSCLYIFHTHRAAREAAMTIWETIQCKGEELDRIEIVELFYYFED